MVLSTQQRAVPAASRVSGPAWGLAWCIWQRHRMGLCAYAAGVAATVAVLALAPRSASGEALVRACAVVAGVGLLYLVGVFTNPEADVVSAGSGYPSHLLLLPVSARALTGWPMLFAGATVALTWTAVGGVALPVRGVHVPVLWPAAMAVAGMACLQAALWYPVGMPYLRLALVCAIAAGLPMPAVLAGSLAHPDGVLVLVYGSLAGAAYLAGVAGVAGARRSEGVAPSGGRLRRAGTVAPTRTATASALPPFASAMGAQTWADWRRNGLVFPVAVAAACAVMSLPLLFVRDNALVGDNLVINLYVRVYIPVLWALPVLLSWVLGSGPRKGDVRRADRSLHPFLAVRPLTCAQLVEARLRVCARSALLGWLVALAFTVGWLLLPARHGTDSGPAVLLLAANAGREALWPVVACLLVSLAWVWRNQAVSLVSDLSGEPWLIYGYPAARIAAAVALFVLLSGFVFSMEGAGAADPSTLPLPPFLVWYAVWGLALKAAGTAWAARSLLRQRLASPRALLLGAAGWACVVALLAAAARAAIPAHGPTFIFLPEAWRTTPVLVVTAMLYVPLARLALAPLALARNRHG